MTIDGQASGKTKRRQKAVGGRRVTLASVLAYTALWAWIICIFQGVAKLQQGVHTIAEAQLSDDLMLIAIALLFVALGIPLAIALGRSRQVVPVSLGCFAFGLTAIPILVFVLMTLSRLGVIDVD